MACCVKHGPTKRNWRPLAESVLVWHASNETTLWNTAINLSTFLPRSKPEIQSRSLHWTRISKPLPPLSQDFESTATTEQGFQNHSLHWNMISKPQPSITWNRVKTKKVLIYKYMPFYIMCVYNCSLSFTKRSVRYCVLWSMWHMFSHEFNFSDEILK